MRAVSQRIELEGIEVSCGLEGLCLGIAIARNAVSSSTTPELDVAIAAAIHNVPARQGLELEKRTKAVRELLRHGKYRPTGRAKPASEYLLGAAREDRFPRIGTLVDAANLVSLDTLLPISLIDLDRAGTEKFAVRRGREGESYVFNAGGQEIDLTDLLLTAALPDDRPLANPVKDSMSTKLGPDAKDVLAVIYAPAALAGEAAFASRALAGALARFGAAERTAHGVLEL